MSPSWRNRIAIALYPDRVVWLRAARGLRPQIEAKGILPCPVDHALLSRGPLTVLDQALREAGTDGAQVAIVISNRLVRYAVTPNPDSANNRQELDLMARYAFERTHGETVKDWDIRLSDAAPGKTGLASAVDRALIEASIAAVTANGGRVSAIQPYLMAAFNRIGNPHAGRRSGIFVMVEPERLCQLAWQNGGWSAVQQGHAGADWQDHLDGWVDRFAMNTDFSESPATHLCAPESILPTRSARDREIGMVLPTWPAGLSPLHDHEYAGAMLALA